MPIKDTLSEWAGPISALVAVAALGLTGGYYAANSENAALRRDLDLATNGRGLSEAMATLEQLSDATNNVFRFEQHAQELTEMEIKVDALTESLRVTENQVIKLKLDLEMAQQRAAGADLPLRISSSLN